MPRDDFVDIACLGWGSLIWDQRSLPVRGKWFDDGPILPIEFARESCGGRITLVIADVEYTVRSLWALMSVTTLEKAKSQLAEREGVSEKNIKYSIGFWDRDSGKTHGRSSAQIGQWAESKDLDAVVWTNLKWGLKDSQDEMPTYNDVLTHLKDLPHEKRKAAEEYVRRAPVQIDTEFRRRIQMDLGWLPMETPKA